MGWSLPSPHIMLCWADSIYHPFTRNTSSNPIRVYSRGPLSWFLCLTNLLLLSLRVCAGPKAVDESFWHNCILTFIWFFFPPLQSHKIPEARSCCLFIQPPCESFRYRVCLYCVNWNCTTETFCVHICLDGKPVRPETGWKPSCKATRRAGQKGPQFTT